MTLDPLAIFAVFMLGAGCACALIDIRKYRDQGNDKDEETK